MTEFNYYISRCKTCKKLSDYNSNKQHNINDFTQYFCTYCGTKTMQIKAINSNHNIIMRDLQKNLHNARFSLHDTDLDKIIIQLEPTSLGIEDDDDDIDDTNEKHKCQTCDKIIPIESTYCSIKCNLIKDDNV